MVVCLIGVGDFFILMCEGVDVMFWLLWDYLDIEVVICVLDLFVFGVFMECVCLDVWVLEDIVVVGFGVYDILLICVLILMIVDFYLVEIG